MKNIFFILFFSLSAAASGLKEVPMLEAKTTIGKTKKAENKLPTKDNNESKELKKITEKNIDDYSEKKPEVKIVQEEKKEIFVMNEKLTEDKLKEIIKNAEESPDPEVTVDMAMGEENLLIKKDLGEYTNLEAEQSGSNVVKKYYEFIDTLNEKLKEHDFEDKTEVIHVGHEVAKELRSNKIIPDIELGVGMSYQDSYSLKKDRAAMFDQEQSGKFFVKERDEEMDMDSIPLYVTGRYKLPQVNDWQPYLKLNLGYAVNNIGGKSNSRYKSINDAVNSQNGSYYGMGGGIEYNNGLTLDLMYQVSEGGSTSDSQRDDDSRVTVSVEYKLDI
ncbi:outer membrane beta-barrel protein [Fusobacterium ulcerans]|uniref:outer membrane beta-barrel protein n=1 Tax=Fusobacterium ulcerans TaxID=861 RepID=UPI0026EE0F2C|nr:outer membrane beta-barrel protein [Fusobacterium ulcerans]